MTMGDITRLSYWFPKLKNTGLPVPETHIICTAEEELTAIYESMESSIKNGVYSLAKRIKEAADNVGYPCFLRTDHFSGKHDWENNCYLSDGNNIAEHVMSIAYMWECVNMFAPPCDTWIVREFLPTIPHGVCRMYGDMPICKEFRFFSKDGDIQCWHPYWPLRALEQGKAEYFNNNFDYDDFCKLDNMAFALAEKAAKAIDGSWSIDLLETKKGWFVTDMAESNKSYHWEDCEKNVRV